MLFKKEKTDPATECRISWKMKRAELEDLLGDHCNSAVERMRIGI